MFVPVLLGLLAGTPAHAQPAGLPENPVFVNESIAAGEALSRARENLAVGNVDQAVRLLQRVLDDDTGPGSPLGGSTGGLVQSPVDPALYIAARDAAHALILSDPGLLERYRAAQARQAADDLAAGRVRAVEHARFLTPAGLEATLLVAGEHAEHARFWSAWHTLLPARDHPDARGDTPLARRAARLAGTLARYLDSPAAAALVREWVAAAGGGADIEAPVPVSPPATPGVRTPLGAQGPADITALVSRPVASCQFAAPDLTPGGRVPRGSGDLLPAAGRDLRIMPALSGDRVILSGPRGISALDRLTLAPIWTLDTRALLGLEPDPDERDGNARGRIGGRSYEDVSSVAVRGPWTLAAVSGEPRDEEQDLVVAADSRTGDVRWARWAGQIDPALTRARVRGGIAFEGDLAIVSFRKELRERRLGAALYLAGLDLDDGSTRWTSLVGSIGALPFSPASPVTDGGLVHEGLYLRSDRMGLLAAYIAGSGRPLWVRRFPGESANAASVGSSWHTQLPVVRGEMAVVLTPDRRQLVAVSLATGAVAWRVDDQRLGLPLYTLAVGEHLLALVGEDTIGLLDTRAPAEGAARRARFEAPGIRGRVVAAGVSLLVPLVGGVAALDPAVPPDAPGSPERPTQVAIDDSGSLVADSGQLLVADDTRLHSYLSWDAGDTLLSQRIAASPHDPSAPIALTEFAYRAGRHERVLFAADAAVAALKASSLTAADLAETVEPQRRRLLGALRLMVNSTLRDPPRAPAAPAASAGPGPLSPDLLMGVLERCAALSRTSEETAAHRLDLGRAHERAGRFVEAVAVYQALLASADLCAAMWQGERLGLRADAEATRRLEAVIAARGRAVYASADAALTAALSSLPPDATVADLEGLAKRHPVGLAAPALWQRVAALYALQDRPRAAARALETGLQAAARMPDAPAPVVGALTADLITNLRARGLLAAAAETLRDARDRFPALTLPRPGGTPVDAAALAAELGREIDVAHRWPAVGPPTADRIETFAGWTIVEPTVRPVLGSAPAALMLRHDDGRSMLVAQPREPDAPLAPVWTSPADADPTVLVRLDNTGAVLFQATPAGGVLERLETPGGGVAWRTRAFNSHFVGPEGGGAIATGPRLPGAPQPPAPDRVRTPLDGTRPLTELLVCTDERSVALVERSGRAVAFDADSGSTLWAAGLPIARVFDCDVVGSVLAVAGERDTLRPDGTASGSVPTLLIVEARSGRVLHEIDPPAGQVRWLRLSVRGDLVLGCAGGLCGIDPETAEVHWLNTDPLAAASLRAWALGQSLLLVASDRTLWSIAFSSGATRPVALRRGDDEGVRIETASEPQAYAIHNGGLALCSPKGLLLIDRDGNVVGGDALASEDTLLGPLPADGLLATIDAGIASRVPATEAGPVYAFHLLESGTGRLVSSTPLALPEPPNRLALMPGRVALSAGRATVVYHAPAQPR